MIRIQTLGTLRASGPAGEIRVGRKEFALLVFLARRCPHAVPRAELAALLWDSRRESQARQSLRQALLRLRRAIPVPIEVGAEAIALPAGQWELDASRLEADLVAGQLQQAVARYEGDFLLRCEELGQEGFRHWVEVEREQLRRRVAAALDRLGAEAEQSGDRGAAVAWAERCAALSPWDERAHRRLIEVLRLAGRVDDAIDRHASFTARLRREFDFEPSEDLERLGADLDRGALARRHARPSPGSRALFTPDFIGRGTALSEISTHWARARGGSGAAILVEGEPGIGKTRLCEEFLRAVSDSGKPRLVLRARGSEAGHAVSWTGLRELLAPLRDGPGISGTAPGALAALGPFIPGLAERFAGARGGGEWLPAEAVMDALGSVAAETPMIVLVDDAPLIDPASRQLLMNLARLINNVRVLLIFTARGDDLDEGALGPEALQPAVHRLRLPPLSETDVEALLGSMLEFAPDDRRRLAGRLVAENGGNPFQLIQLTAALLDDGQLAPSADGTWQFVEDPTRQRLPLPAGVREAVTRRLERLQPAARRVAEAAAVLATPVDRATLQRVTGLSAVDVDQALDDLVARRLLRPAPAAGGSYEFAHDVSRRVMYDLLPAARRQAIHRTVLWNLRATGDDATTFRAARQYHRARAGAAPARAAHWLRAHAAGRVATLVTTLVATLVVLAAAYGALTPRDPRPQPVVAVGLIRDYTRGDTPATAFELADMLATNLARLPELNVLSSARLYEILGQLNNGVGGNSDQTIVAAARRAGATDLVEGAVYALDGGEYRLHLRRIDITSGAVREAAVAEASDRFALVDGATAELARGFGLHVPTLRVRDVTTSSLVAYRFYEEGLRAWYRAEDRGAARRLFLAAISEDSMFAMAVYRAAVAELMVGTQAEAHRLLARAAQLSEQATDRERLLVRAAWGLHMDDPGRIAVAETLTVRYPTEPDGHLMLGRSLIWVGDFLEALPHLRRVVAMDSLSLVGDRPSCRACEAMREMMVAYMMADSLDAAERVGREWIRQRPRSAAAWHELSDVMQYAERFDDAEAAYRQVLALAPGWEDGMAYQSRMAIAAGRFELADRLRAQWERARPRALGNVLLHAVIGLRAQGRLREALREARRLRARFASPAPAAPPPAEALFEAHVLFELGRYRESAALFDSLARFAEPHGMSPGKIARHQTWMLTLRATALAALGDAAALRRIADTLAVVGRQSGYGRDHRLHHHVRGLLYNLEGRPAEAAGEFRRAIFSTTNGYTRTNSELARTLLRLGRPREAIAWLQPAFRGTLAASNGYVTRTELHAQLGEAFEAAGERDSAATHYRRTLDAWRNADPELHARRVTVRQRLEALGAEVVPATANAARPR